MRRRSWPSGGGLGGLTMSEDGGLEEVEESLRAAASCWPSWATTCLRAASSASRASTRACSRRQLGQRAVSLALMAINHTDSASGALHSTGERPPEKFVKMIAFLKSRASRRERTNNHVERVNRKLRH